MVALDHVRGIDELADFRRILEKCRELVPVAAPRADDEGILAAPCLLETIKLYKCHFFCCRFVDRLQIGRHLLKVLVGYIARGIADLVDDALLNLCLRIAGRNRLREACQVVHTGDEDVLYTTVFQVIEHAEPELRRLVLADPHAQYVFVPVEVDADDHVCCLVHDRAVLLHLEMDGIQEDNGIHSLQRAVLPLLNQRDDLVRDVGDHRRGDIHAIQVLQMILPPREPRRIREL